MMIDKNRNLLGALVLCLLAMPLSAGAVSPLSTTDQATVATWSPFAASAIDGSPLEGELTRVVVPERRHGIAPGEAPRATIEIAVVRFRTSNPNPGPPIFLLAGGPGGSGIEAAALTASHPQIRLLELADVIGIDQRGTGLSIPNLVDEALGEDIPLDQKVTRRSYVSAARRAARRTAAHWRGQGVDLGAYNTRESADDIDAVRRALGLKKIALYGASYGSHLGLAYLRQHEDTVERAVLMHVEGPNHTWKLPSTVQQQLEQLEAMLAGNPVWGERPPLLAEIERTLRELDQNEVFVQDDSGRVLVSPFDLQAEISQRMGSIAAIAELPALFEQFDRGDWSALATVSRENHRPGIAAMPLMMDCSSAGTQQRVDRVQRETLDPANLLGDAILLPVYPEVCRDLPVVDLGDRFRSRITSTAPVLFVSGSLDVRTPPSNLDEILSGFTNGVHIIATNASHDSRQLMSRDFRTLLQRFLRGEHLEGTTLRLPEPIFISELRETDPDR